MCERKKKKENDSWKNIVSKAKNVENIYKR